MPQSPLALICSVPLEAEPLHAVLDQPSPLAIGRRPAVSGVLDGVAVLAISAGMGKTNAAQAVTALLETRPVRGVIGFGVAGAYADGSLSVGDVALASAEIYGDEGVAAPGVWLSAEGIGIPLLQRGKRRRFNEFPLDPARVGAAQRALSSAGIPARVGPFITVSSCSGTAARGAELAKRWGAICESMEGAALAHVCELYDIPFLEVRGVSNAVADRDLSQWRLREAAEAAAAAARAIAGTWDG